MMVPKKPAAAADASLERQLGTLDELADIGMTLAEALERKILSQAASGAVLNLAEMAESFSNIARAIRQTIALRAELAKRYKMQERTRELPARTPLPPRRTTPLH